MDTVDLGPLEADFAALHADLARIAETKLSLGNAAIGALDQILQEGQAAPAGAEAVVGAKFQAALLQLLRENAASDMHGNLGFNIDQASLMTHGAPVFQEAVAAMQGKVQSILDEITNQAVAGAKAEPAGPKAGVKLKLDLASMFAGLLQGATVKKTPR